LLAVSEAAKYASKKGSKGKKGKKAVATDLPTLSAAPTAFCDSRPIDKFFYEVDFRFVESTKQFQDAIDNNPDVGPPFQPVLDAANVLRAGGSAIMQGITGCVSQYPMPEVTVPEVTEFSTATPKKKKKGKKSGKKSSKIYKATEEPEELVTAAPTMFDLGATVMNAVDFTLQNSYFFNSFNDGSGAAWTYGVDDYDLPVRDIPFVPGAFNEIVCGYYQLSQQLIFSHQAVTGTDEIVAHVEEYSAFIIDFYGATGPLVSPCSAP